MDEWMNRLITVIIIYLFIIYYKIFKMEIEISLTI
jgi:hypothetical protein